MGSKKPAVGRRRDGKPPTSGVGPLLQRAIELHNAGRTRESLDLCQSLLAARPNDVDVLHLGGLNAYLLGEPELANDLLQRAIGINATIPSTHNHLGLALEALNRLEEAAASYQRAIVLEPGHAEAHNNLGNALNKAGRLQEASASYHRAIELTPLDAVCHFNLGLLLERMGKAEEAIFSFRRSLEIEPGKTEVLFHLGCCLQQLGQMEEAVTCFSRFIAFEPGNFKAQLNLGAALYSLNRLEEAVKSFSRALALSPNDADALYDLGSAYLSLNRLEDATACFERAIAANPSYAKAHSNLGMILVRVGDLNEAESHYRLALEIDPDNVEANSNLGNLYRLQGRFDDANEYLGLAVRLQPERAEARWNLAQALLVTGNLVKGWEEYDQRAQAQPNSKEQRGFPQPWWQGGELKGKTLLIWGEQGLGDELMFANVLPDIIAAAEHCVVECEPRLVSLFARSFPRAEFVARSTPPHPRTLGPDIDLQIPMGSLPRWFRPSIESFPLSPSYLLADPERVVYWKQRLDAVNGQPKIGICWRSMHRNTERNLSYTELGQWGPIFSVPGVSFVNLQYDDCRAELDEARKKSGVEIHAWDDIDLMNDLDEVAALTAALDCVVTPCTSVAMMAGAVGKPVLEFILRDNWRRLGTDRLPWYPNTKLFIRDWDEPWDEVLAVIAGDLAHIVKSENQDCHPVLAPKRKAPIVKRQRVLPVLKKRDIPRDLSTAIDHHRAGRLAQAEELYRQILEVSPEHQDALHLLGRLALDRGDAQTAIELITRSIKGNPDPDCFFNLARAHQALHNTDDAIACYQKALSIKPDFAEAHNNLGNEYKDQGKIEEAIACYQQALAIEPDFAEAHCNLGNALRARGDLDRAVSSYHQALSFNPDYPEAINGLGTVLDDRCDVDGAITCFLQALAIKDDNQATLANLGRAYRKLGDIVDSLSMLERAVNLRPDQAEAHWNLAQSLLMSGNLSRGWREYDWRWNQEHVWQYPPPVKREFPQSWWQGDNLKGKTLLIWGEQGLGDEILFANVLPDVIASAGHCVVECEPRLVSLFARSFPSAEFVARRFPADPRTLASDIDLQIPIGSLPRWYRPSIESFPSSPGYLLPDPERVVHWKKRLAALNGQPKIGICWRSMFKNAERNLSYTELGQWGPIFSAPGVSFVNLQYDECRAELEEARKKFGVEIHGWDDIDLMNDLDEVAALTAVLDCVITPATSVAAMAGALGKPVLEFCTRDNWPALGTGRMPWFPNTQLFMRDWGETWEVALTAIARKLSEPSTYRTEDHRQQVVVAKSDQALSETIARALKAASEFQQSGHYSEAEAIYSQILKVQPNNPEALHLLGVMAHQMGDSHLAVELIRSAISFDPQAPTFHNNLGSVLDALGREEEAVACYLAATNIYPGFADAYYNLGTVQYRLGRKEEAVASFYKALELVPNLFKLHNNLGSVLADLSDFDGAIRHYQRALEIEPDHIAALANLGNAYRQRGDIARSVDYHRRVLSLNADRAEFHWNYSLSLLMSGNVEQGWLEYESRWKGGGEKWFPPAPTNRNFPQSWWQGDNLKGKTLLIWGEQGLGDEILFANVLPDVIASAGHCVVECEPRLVSLFARSFPSAEFVARRFPADPRTLASDIDLQIPIGSLPRWYRPSIESFPSSPGYLLPDPERVVHWKKRLAALNGQPKIGICWRSMFKNAERNLSYTELGQWGPIFSAPGVSFVNLQYDECRAELEEARKKFGVEIHGWDDIDLMNDLDEVAALTAVLDCVITPATSVAAMAGALGKPVLEFCTRDNWPALGTGRMPWFPNTQLFMRDWGETWEVALTAIARKLSEPSTYRTEDHRQQVVVAKSDQALSETIARALKAASEFQQSGHYSEAEAIYSQILKVQPNNPEALHLLGVMAHQMGDSHLAVELIRSAIGIDPTVPAFHNNLGNVLKIQGKLEQAVACYERALRLAESFFDAHNNLGDTLRMLGKLPEAARHLERALALNPDSSEAHNNLGSILKDQNRLKEAAFHYRRAIALNPDDEKAPNNLGSVLIRQGEIDAAIAAFQRAIELRPNLAEAHNNLALAFNEKGDSGQAIISARRSIETNPRFMEAYVTLSTLLLEQNRVDEAKVLCEEADALGHRCVDLYLNRGVAARAQGKPAEALRHFQQALAIDSTVANVHWNQSTALLQCGNLEEGWAEYDWRWQWDFGRTAKRDFPQPWWAGEEPGDKTMLVWAEQGVGDEILFASVLPDIIAAARHCVVECDPRLVSLFARSFPDAEFVARSTPPDSRTLMPDIDLQIPMGSLPKWFRTNLESFPQHPGYLVPDPQRVAYWKKRLDVLGDRPKIGICWRSKLRSVGRDIHYTNLSQWEDILSVPGVTFIRLQYDDCQEELEAVREEFGVEIHDMEGIDLLNDLDDAVALTAAMDRVITTGTAVAAIAGAIGQSVLQYTLSDNWTALGSDRLPWFPNTKLFVRKWGESWERVLSGIAQDLENGSEEFAKIRRSTIRS